MMITMNWLLLCILFHCCYGFLNVRSAYLHVSSQSAAVTAFDPKVVENVAAIFGVASQALTSVQLFDSPATQLAVDKLHARKAEVKSGLRGDDLLQRSCFTAFKKAVISACALKENTALMVYGPRGVGKSTMVAAALQVLLCAVCAMTVEFGRAHVKSMCAMACFRLRTSYAVQDIPGVLALAYKGDGSDSIERFERAITKVTTKQLESSEAEPGDRFRAIMATYRVKYRRRPIVVVELNSEVSPQALKQLLLDVKQLGFEEMLATFVVVVSASRSALGLTIGMSELRVKGYTAPDFDGEEAQQYLVQHLNCSIVTTVSITAEIGTRAMHLVEICDKCKGADTEAEVLERVAEYKKAQTQHARRTLNGFMGLMKKNPDFSKDRAIAFFDALYLGSPDVDESVAWEAFGLTDDPKLLLTSLAEYHAFAVDPFTSKVHMQSKFMEIAIEQYLAATREITSHID